MDLGGAMLKFLKQLAATVEVEFVHMGGSYAVRKKDYDPILLNLLKSHGSFYNTKRKYPSDPEFIYLTSEDEFFIYFPRNLELPKFVISSVEQLFTQESTKFVFSPQFQLLPFQENVVRKALFSNKDLIIESPCGSGKTFMAMS